jgi:hypothetical protein
VPVDVDRLTTELALTGIPWDRARWDRFVRDLSPEEQALEVQMLVDSAEPPPRDVWRDVLDVLGAAAKVGADVAGIESGVAAIVALVKL